MLNAKYKKEAIAACEEAQEQYNSVFKETLESAERLHSKKEYSIQILRTVDNYIHCLSNKPDEIVRIASAVALNRREFEKEIKDIQLESRKNEKIEKSIAGVGALAGTGIAAFGPSAAMGIATTFGTASTGTAIATLTGVVQTNAALAWLGGGALAAGGGGMVAGEALLALAGPIGWTIGGAALVGSGVLANSRNKNIAKQAEEQLGIIRRETLRITEVKERVESEKEAITALNIGVNDVLRQMYSISSSDYKSFTSEEKGQLMLLLNSSETLSVRIGEKISCQT